MFWIRSSKSEVLCSQSFVIFRYAHILNVLIYHKSLGKCLLNNSSPFFLLPEDLFVVYDGETRRMEG